MAFEQKDFTGGLFKNTRKEKDTHPDYNGNCKVGGVEYWMDAWIKKGDKGPWMSFSFRPKEAKKEALPGGFEDMDDSIPF